MRRVSVAPPRRASARARRLTRCRTASQPQTSRPMRDLTLLTQRPTCRTRSETENATAESDDDVPANTIERASCDAGRKVSSTPQYVCRRSGSFLTTQEKGRPFASASLSMATSRRHGDAQPAYVAGRLVLERSPGRSAASTVLNFSTVTGSSRRRHSTRITCGRNRAIAASACVLHPASSQANPRIVNAKPRALAMAGDRRQAEAASSSCKSTRARSQLAATADGRQPDLSDQRGHRIASS